MTKVQIVPVLSITQLNNELAATQRELAKKNNQLEQQKQELKLLNQELSATIEELEKTRDELVQSEKMASLGRLVSGFAHEINTPIGIAVTAASAINEAGQRLNDMLSQDEVSETELVANIDKMIKGGKLTFSNVRLNSFPVLKELPSIKRKKPKDYSRCMK
jgi:C4-dicarboxylate-specific signal transduction histidine kinase